MCTSTRMIYILTYRALREFNAGRKSVNPIAAMHQMETSVPNSVCHHTHDVMMLANRSFQQRHLAPVGVHEAYYHHSSDKYGYHSEWSWLRLRCGSDVHFNLNQARNRAYAIRALNTWNYSLSKIDNTAAWLKSTTLFASPGVWHDVLGACGVRDCLHAVCNMERAKAQRRALAAMKSA